MTSRLLLAALLVIGLAAAAGGCRSTHTAAAPGTWKAPAGLY